MKKIIFTIAAAVFACAILSSCTDMGMTKPNVDKTPQKTVVPTDTAYIPTPDLTPDTLPATPDTDPVIPTPTDILPDTLIPTPVTPSPNNIFR